MGGDGSERRPEAPWGAWLRVQQGFYEGLEIPVGRDRVIIGRGQGADVVLAESTMSRAHAAFLCEDEGLFVEDLGSTNGTLLNGQSAKRRALRDGDELRLGRLQLRVCLPG